MLNESEQWDIKYSGQVPGRGYGPYRSLHPWVQALAPVPPSAVVIPTTGGVIRQALTIVSFGLFVATVLQALVVCAEEPMP